MKRVDLHVHTVKNDYLDDQTFLYSSVNMVEYVTSNNIDVIAITNHNLFDENNFNIVKKDLSSTTCKILPGIEISLEDGHILVIGDDTVSYRNSLKAISDKIKLDETDNKYKMDISSFNENVCGKGFLIIPHYFKSPSINKEIIKMIDDEVYCGEVKSRKQFFKVIKENSITPVLFSDKRITSNKEKTDFQNNNRFTYFDISNLEFDAIKNCLTNSKYVSLSLSGEHKTFDILNSTVKASSGINVLIGKRSTGKTFLLNSIYKGDSKKESKDSSDMLYIEQFEISKESKDDDFARKIKTQSEECVIAYFNKLYDVLDYIEENIIGEENINEYVNTLKDYSENALNDEYSKSYFFNYIPISMNSYIEIDKILESAKTLINLSQPYKNILNKYVNIERLVEFVQEIINNKRAMKMEDKIHSIYNEIAKSISDDLNVETSVKSITDVDFNKVLKRMYVKEKFNSLIDKFNCKLISNESIYQTYYKEVSINRITNKTIVKSILGVPKDGKIDYLFDNNHFDAYLNGINDSNIKNAKGNYRYRLLFDYDAVVKDAYNSVISGGQRSEFLLLDKLNSYKNYDIVLIDEMESSFDNPFLNEEINKKIREIANTSTVFISTHNNNIGVSLQPDFYIYHEKKIVNNQTVYKRYYGRSVDDVLFDKDGETVKLSSVLLETMEANKEEYKRRKKIYGNTDN